MAATVSELELIVRARNQASRALNTVGADLDRLNRKSGKVAKGFAGLGKAAVAAGALLVVGIGVGIAKAISSFASFDQKMTESLAIMGDVSFEMRREMSDTARDVAKNTTFSAEQAAESYFFLASAGLDAAQSIAALPAVAKFAQAGNFDMALATDLATDAMSALGLTVPDAVENLENLNRVQDVLVKANTLANASVEQFAQALVNKAGPAMRLANIDIEEGAAVLAVFADQGIKGQVAGNMFSRALKGLQINALKNTGAFDRMNIAVFDNQGNMRGMADIVEDLSGAMDGLSDAQKTQALLDLGFSARQQDVIKMLIGTEEKIRGYESALRDAGGVTDEVANNQLKSINAQWGLFKAAIADVWLELGEQLAPMLRTVITMMRDWAANTLPGLVEKLKTLSSTIFGTVAPAFMGLVDAVKATVDWFKDLSEGTQDAIKAGGEAVVVVALLTVGVGALGVAIKLALAPVTLIAAAIFAIGFAFKMAYDQSEEFRTIVDGVINWLKTTGLDTINAVWINIRDTAIAIWGEIGDEVLAFVEAVVGYFKDTLLPFFVNEIIPKVIEFAKKFVAFLVEIGPPIWDFIQEIIGFWQDVLIPFFLDVIIPAILEIVASIIEVWQNLWPDIKKVLDSLLDFFTENFLPFLEDVLLPITEAIIDDLIIAWKLLDGPVTTVIGIILGVLDGLITALGGILDFIRGIFTGDWGLLWGGIESIFLGVWNAFEAIVWGVFGAIGGAIDAAIDILGRAWARLWNGIKSFFSGIWEDMKTIASTALTWIKLNVIGPAIEAINSVIRAINSIPGVPNVSTIPLDGFVSSGGGGTRTGSVFTAEQQAIIDRLPRFGHGGFLSRGRLGIAGELGPELILGGRSGSTIIPGSGSSLAGGGDVLHIHLEIDGQEFAQVIFDEQAREQARNGVRT